MRTKKQPEPLAAILAEMHAELDCIDDTNVIPVVYIKNRLPRIEAAAERERIQRDKVSFRCGDCANFGGDCDAGDVDGNEDCIACEKFRRRAATGNAAAMRAALESAHRALKLVCEHAGEFVQPRLAEEIIHSGAAVERALSAPARNCDVGTAEEQAERHERFCAAHYKADAVDAQCFGCPASDKKETDCEFVWGQLPFAPAEGGAE